jgi:hypothetical protein
LKLISCAFRGDGVSGAGAVVVGVPVADVVLLLKVVLTSFNAVSKVYTFLLIKDL